MLRTTAASLLALATAILPVQAQTVLYGEPTPPSSVFPQAQPFFAEPQPTPLATQPLYYESVPAIQPPDPAPFQPEQDNRRFRPVSPQGILPRAPRPLAPVEQYRPPQNGPVFGGQEVIVAPPPPAPPQQQPQQFRPAEPVALPLIARPEPRVAPVQTAPAEAPRAPVPAPAPAQPEVTESEALREFSTELSRIIALGERYRAASPGFLEDLKTLAGKYGELSVRVEEPAPVTPRQAEFIGPPPPAPVEAASEPAPPRTAPALPAGPEIAMAPEPAPQPAPPPVFSPQVIPPQPEPQAAPEPQELPQALPPTSASVVYLRDDFSDGEYLSNPAWSVRQGRFTVDPAYGLRPFSPETTAPAQVTPQALLQYLIGDGKPETPEPTGDNGASLIEAQTDIGNAFSLVATITDHGGEGAAHFIMHQGGANWLGYRLELRAGPRPLVVLARRGSSGYKDIMKVEAPGFTSGKPHQLRWARLSDGQMFVLIDGRPIITARDTVFRQGWKGFAYFTADADVSMRNIRIAEPVER